MRSYRFAAALVSVLALGSTLVVWCPCPASAEARAESEAHACCRGSEPSVRSAGHDCCRPCRAAGAATDAETVSAGRVDGTPAAPLAVALVPPAAAAVSRRRPVAACVSPPPDCPQRPLRI